jgi:hypothetical protein
MDQDRALYAHGASMMRFVKRFLWGTGAAIAGVVLSYLALITWPSPLFAHSVSEGRLVVASDRPIPHAGGARLLRDCERLLERSQLMVEGRTYRINVTGADWLHRLFFLRSPVAGGIEYYLGFRATAFLSGADFEAGRLIKWDYVVTPPRTLAYFCAHELTHVVVDEHVGVIGWFRRPEWVQEGFPDYVAIEERQSFEELRDILGDRPVDLRMMQTYGTYPRYRLLVSYFLEKQGWTVEQLLRTRLSTEEAMAIMRADDGSGVTR